MTRKTVNINLNRVEGDLEISLDTCDGVVTEARTVGTLYRGFEQIMVGRSPRDAMVITPRVCGICGTAHLFTSVMALEQIWNIEVPPNATRIRNLCLLAEGIQNDLRQTFLFFAPDFAHQRYRSASWFQEVTEKFEPFKGSVYLQTLENTREITKIVAHFGGQWPHSSYMLPGGVTMPPTIRLLTACQASLDQVQRWYERAIIGAPLDQWMSLESAEDYLSWLEAHPHASSSLGLLSRCTRALGLHRAAAGTPHMLSVGSLCDPMNPSGNAETRLIPGGFYNADRDSTEAFDQSLISEHVRHSWFRPYEDGRHPFDGETVPDYQPGSDRYTWSKAPRYGSQVVQTGPLAELLIGGDKLIADLHRKEGGSAWLRQFARVRRIAYELSFARKMLSELTEHMGEPHINNPSPSQQGDGDGFGLVMAARGALGHWVRIRDGLVDKYQIVTPTSWNASPRDSHGAPGHWEQSLVGLRIADLNDPIEVGHIIRSHDPCLVCTVHMLDTDKKLSFAP